MDEFDGKRRAERGSIGLCARCRYVRPQSTKRGAVFYRCALSDEDDRFTRYPPIPVVRCTGYEAAGGHETRTQSE